MIIRGTTPKHTFVLPFSTDQVRSAKITYCQNKQIALVKTGDDLVMTEDRIETKLTQAETLAFVEGCPVAVQVRVLTHGGDALTSDAYVVSVGCCLDGEVLA